VCCYFSTVCVVISVPCVLLFQYREYEQVVVEDRIEKEKARRKQEQEAIELKASIKVHSTSVAAFFLNPLTEWTVPQLSIMIIYNSTWLILIK